MEISSTPRRPLVLFTGAFALGVCFCYLFAPPASALIAGALLAGITLAAGRSSATYKAWISLRHIRSVPSPPSVPLFPSILSLPFVSLLAAVFCCAALYAHAAFTEKDPLEALMQDGQSPSARVEGVVLACQQPDAARLTLTIQRDDQRKTLVRLRGTEGHLPAPRDLVGARLGFQGTLSYPDTAGNPGGFDYRLYLLSVDIRVIADGYVEMTDVSPAPFPWSVYHRIACAKYAFLDRLDETLPPEQAALFAGMMFGGREGIDDETYALFQRGGVAHILSVSGLHVAMVYAFVSAVLGKRRTKAFYFTTLGVLFFYAVLSEFSPTVTRAVLMIGIHIGAKLLHRRYDMLTGVCAAALLMLLVRPLCLFGTGFQLSYLAVISLSFALPFLTRFTGFRNRLTGRTLTGRERGIALERRPETLRRAAVFSFLLPSFVIQPFLMPITAFRFHLISLSAFVVNLAVIALSALIVPFGLVLFGLTALAYALPALAPALDFPCGALASAAGFLVELLSASVRAGDALPFGSFRVCAPSAAFVLFFYAILWFLMSDSFALFLYHNKNRKTAALRLAALALACALCGLSPVCRPDTAAYTFVDVGQGDCLHIRTPDGRNYLVDGGGSENYEIGTKVLLPYLYHNGVGHLDGIFVSHLHTDHFKGLSELAREMRVDAWYVYAGS
ncbi:MAG: ComEC/Rec2 family competence protein, partial [Clostridiales bacterium]|nr:ComEC/Rec2 family competence protein [Clostridiales bacterium]